MGFNWSRSLQTLILVSAKNWAAWQRRAAGQQGKLPLCLQLLPHTHCPEFCLLSDQQGVRFPQKPEAHCELHMPRSLGCLLLVRLLSQSHQPTPV